MSLVRRFYPKRLYALVKKRIKETRACPSCPGLIAGADPHYLCFECLGDRDIAEAVQFMFAIPAGQMAPFAGEEDDEDFSLSGTSGSGIHGSPPPRSVRQDFPLVKTMAAERVGLPKSSGCWPARTRRVPACPPLEESLAAHLLPQAVGWADIMAGLLSENTPRLV